MTAQNATSPPIAQKEPSAVARFFSNPIVGMVGTLASIIGVLLAVYFFVQGAKFRELVYYVNPAQAIVVKTGEASRLRVLVGERELKSDVTTAQIAIWNRGTESLRAGDVLEPLTIRTSPPVAILEATIRKKSRNVVDITLDQKHLEEGVVGISWNILEQGDGGVIQLVYASNPDSTKILVSGVIEGEHEIRELRYLGTITPVTEQVREQRDLAYIGWFMLAVGSVMSGLTIANWRQTPALLKILSLLAVLVSIVGCVYFILQSRVPEPPFGF
jgi:hypothetical protein